MNKAGKLDILIEEGSFDKKVKVFVDARATVTLTSMSIRVDVCERER